MIDRYEFGALKSTGQPIYNYTMRNQNGMSVTISEFGGAIVEICVPDRYGRIANVVCGYESLHDYTHADGYLGAIIGRTTNRIANASFTLDGKTYSLFRNDGKNSLHGGKVGWSHRVWKAKTIDGEDPKLILTLHSPDGEEGYPGNVDVTVTYALLSNNALSIHYEATTDQRTPISLTNHTYFNLGGFYAEKPIYNHIMQIDADTYLPSNAESIPTGEIRSVTGTPFDFREPKAIGKEILSNHPEICAEHGYNHCLNFTGGATETPVQRIAVYEPDSGREMTVFTDQPCVQFYSGNYFENRQYPLKNGCPRKNHYAFALETQMMPDSVNHPNFTNTILNPGETYTQTTIYQFSTQ